ncbi:MFS transporter [bacterium]|nr:MFS transporter [bacterium]
MKNKLLNLTLLVLYLGFISIGLPDQILGISWVSMRETFDKGLSQAGTIMMFVTTCTIISSFLSPFFIRKFTTNTILIFSTALIAIALFGFGFAKSWNMILFFCLPMGLGAGCVDASLNNFASKNFSAKHLNWLHASWGLGAAAGAYIVTCANNLTSNWRVGYMAVASLLLLLFIIFIFTKKLLCENRNEDAKTSSNHTAKFKELLTLRPILNVLFFFLYAALEVGIGLWIASVFVNSRNYDLTTSGLLVSIYWSSFAIGRFLMGFVSAKIQAEKIITGSLLIALCSLLLLIPHNFYLNAAALIIYGFGIAGIFPCMMNATAKRFGENIFDTLCGVQIGFAGVGVCTFPALIGILMEKISLEILVPFVILITVIMLLIDKKLKKVNV